MDLFIVNADTVKALNAKGLFYDLSDQPVFQELNESARKRGHCESGRPTAFPPK